MKCNVCNGVCYIETYDCWEKQNGLIVNIVVEQEKFKKLK